MTNVDQKYLNIALEKAAKLMNALKSGTADHRPLSEDLAKELLLWQRLRSAA